MMVPDSGKDYMTGLFSAPQSRADPCLGVSNVSMIGFR